MSRQSSLYITILFAMICGALMVAHLTRGTEDMEIQPVFLTTSNGNISRLSPQAAKERTWKLLSLQKIFSIGNIKQAMEIKEDVEGNTFIFDWGDFYIKKFSRDGKFLGSFGKGRGHGPGEFINPTGFTLTKEGHMWVCDPKGVITQFDSAGNVIQILSPKTPAMRISHGSDQHFVIMTTSRGEYLFERYTDSGEFLNAFGQLIEDQSRNGISLMGWLADDGSNTFYYAAQYPGIIASYKMNGEPLFLVQTIDPKPLPKIQVTPKGVWKIEHHKAEISALNIGIAGDELYLLTETIASGYKRKIIDVYSKHDGSYLYSSEVPEPCERAFFTNSYIYTVSGTTMTKWHWQK